MNQNSSATSTSKKCRDIEYDGAQLKDTCCNIQDCNTWHDDIDTALSITTHCIVILGIMILSTKSLKHIIIQYNGTQHIGVSSQTIKLTVIALAVVMLSLVAHFKTLIIKNKLF
jgi:hypothetical protein